jgi:predicted O-methyltransferase YrrM
MGTDNPRQPRSHRFEAPRSAIEAAISRLKAHGNVAPDAIYNPDAPDGLRREIAYHDEDFLGYLGRSAPEHEIDIVQSAVSFLAEHGVCSHEFATNEGRFQTYRSSIRKHFAGGWTSFTPVMERLFYTLTAIRQPARMVEFGCYWGNTLAWFAGPAVGADKLYQAQSIVGIDIDPDMVHVAVGNFRRIHAENDVTLIAADARHVAADLVGPIDFLYLEAKEEGAPPIYLDLLQAVYDKLPKGAWVIAHDIYDKDVIQDLRPYLNWVRDPAHFSASFAFDIDYCGAELSVK